MDFQKIKNKIINFIEKNPLILIVFLLSTLLFLFEHYSMPLWDFTSYTLNAKYLFYHGTYFETLRPPLVPVLLAFFLLFGFLGKYFFVIFVSGLFLYSSIKLSDVIFGKNKPLYRFFFYTLTLSPFMMEFALRTGSELLSLALFELFLVALFEKKISGHYLGLAILTRYNFMIFIPLLFFNKSVKKIIKNFILLFIVIFPWLLFNYLKFGNWLTSFIDAYANNILFRKNIYQQFNFYDLFKVIKWELPFFILGFGKSIWDLIIIRKQWFKENKFNLLFLFLFFVTIQNYITIPLKQIRYLFNLSLPVAYFSVIGLKITFKEYKKITNIFIILILIYFITSIGVLGNSFHQATPTKKMFNNIENDIQKLGINQCEIISPYWVLIDSKNQNVYPPEESTINKSIDKNKIILILKKMRSLDDPKDIKNWNDFPKLYETENYVFLVKKDFNKKNCSKKHIFDKPYVQNHCEILSKKFKNPKIKNLSLKICKKFNKN